VLAAVVALVALAATLGADASTTQRSARSGIGLQDVARSAGLDFRQGAFRFGVSADVPAMMGGGLCWLDYDRDGWLDLFVVNSYAERDSARWQAQGGLPRSALYRNVRGRFVDVTKRSHAGLAVRGTGCVAADLDGDRNTDLFVTTAGTAALLWNEGKGVFREGARAAGIAAAGWRAGAAVGDVNDDGRPDVYVAGYTDVNAPIPGSDAGFPTSHQGVRDLLYLNVGRAKGGHARFREVGSQAGLEVARFDHSLGAVFSDLDRDGRLDLYVANDEDPNRLYQNVRWPGGRRADPAGLGFRFEERAAAAAAADPNAGMGVAVGDYDGDGRADLFVSNSRGQEHAVLRGLPPVANGAMFADGRPTVGNAFGKSFTGWGATWADLDLDGDLDLVLANGAIPVRNLSRDAEPLQVLENLTVQGSPGRFADASGPAGLLGGPRIVGRGVAAADYDNDGDVDVAVNTVGGRLVLLRNTHAGGNWLRVSLRGSRPGARVTAVLPDGRTLSREVQAGSSYLSSEDPRVALGLGEATAVKELSVRLPGGARYRLTDVPANRTVVVPAVASRVAAPKAYAVQGCVRSTRPGSSVARVWDEAILEAIRHDVPAPTTHARNLFHLSAAMWDAWAAYDPKADGYFVTEKHRSADVQAARETAISYAAYRILLWRYSLGAGLRERFARLTETMASLCYRPGYVSARGASPAALGNRIAAALIGYGRRDGALEALRYTDTSYAPANAPLVVGQPGATMHDPMLWQPLALAQFVTQNGLSVPGKVQTFIGANWGRVRGFALRRSNGWAPIDPGPPPIGTASSAAYKQAAVDVIRLSSELDPRDGETIDIGPDAWGNNPLGTNGGHGYAVNPVTDKPYAPNRVPRGDFGRAVAEFWADGPSSETPPGHWNVLANVVSDSPYLAGRIGPSAADRLRWDVELYFALNGAVHDAAIAAWGVKRKYESVRPISMIRYLAGNGQSSDPSGPSYNPEGLPLVPGLIEVVTRESSAPSGRHAALAGHVGEIAIRAWQGAPATPGAQVGVGWILGTSWTPYQRPTFVTPAFPGFVSGHSTFSRAAAEVMAAYTDSEYFPGGLLESRIPAGHLATDQGPSRDVVLQAATYYDAADQAGISRPYGGIHIVADDFAGRRIGSAVGKAAWALAQRYYNGSARR
jgi:ASPIC and UnbV/FG-GAP-like repeat